ncbi:MAG: DUF308 domain-containing protein [Tannerellaceae bacterium]|jgi:uncharacterized membrane protein HdeD (DUF308 family)|nr:DUF308 domain-containing protein [Tannerellaceae bacterium]
MFTIITFHHSLLRAILGVVLGLLFILWPQESVIYLIITTGVFFILSGACSFLLWSIRRKKEANAFPPPLIWGVATGSVLLGVWLVVSPDFFVNIFGLVWGGILVIAGLLQFVSLFTARKWYAVSFAYYLLPTLILLAGILILIRPFEAVVNTFILLGAVSLFYGLNELISWYKFRPKKAEVLPPDASVAEPEAEPESEPLV